MKSTQALSGYCDYYCIKASLEPLAMFSFASLPGALALVFANKKFLVYWSIFALLFLAYSTLVLSGESTGGWNDRLFLSIAFGALLSVTTILSAVAYSSVIKISERKKKND